MDSQPLGLTGLRVPPIIFGGNVFGWTVNENSSFSLLDSMVDQGLNAIDTADSYSHWADGNSGGESETIIGRWIARNPGKREEVVIFTKVGSTYGEGTGGLSKRWILQAVENSLRRLQTDYIDLYFSHKPDPKTPYVETLAAFETLLEQGKIRAIGASNLDATQLADALEAARKNGLTRYQVLQPEYNLYDRESFEGPLQDLCIKESIATVPYFGLAAGFLTGKYRSEADARDKERAGMVKKYFTPKGDRILKALDDVSSRIGASPAEVSIAWLSAQRGVTAPIVSATSHKQLDSLIRAANLTISSQDLQQLTEAGRMGE